MRDTNHDGRILDDFLLWRVRVSQSRSVTCALARASISLSLSRSLLTSHPLSCPLLQPTPSAWIFIKSESQLDSIAYRIICCVSFDRETFAGCTKWSAMAFFFLFVFAKMYSAPSASGIAPKAVGNVRMLYKRPQYLQHSLAAYCQIKFLTQWWHYYEIKM